MIQKFEPLFAEFPFEGDKFKSESYAVVLAAILTLAGRNLFSAAPIFAIDANKARVGKTRIALMIMLLTSGLRPTTITFLNKNEFDKTFPIALTRNARAVLVDNIEHEFNSSQINAAMTSGFIEYRKLGTSETWRLILRAVLLATGNNLQIAGDLTGRALSARLVSEEEHPNLTPHTFIPENRAEREFPQLLPIALRVLRAYLRAKPAWDRAALGSFEEWDAVIRGCVHWLGYADPVATQKGISDTDPDRARKFELLTELFKVYSGRDFTSREVYDRLGVGNFSLAKMLTPPKDTQLDIIWIGKVLRRLRDNRINGLKLFSSGKTGGAARWQIEKI